MPRGYLLFVLHLMLDYFMDPDRTQVVIGPPFRPVHKAYLWVSTVMWAACLPLAWWTLRAWAAEEAARTPDQAPTGR